MLFSNSSFSQSGFLTSVTQSMTMFWLHRSRLAGLCCPCILFIILLRDPVTLLPCTIYPMTLLPCTISPLSLLLYHQTYPRQLLNTMSPWLKPWLFKLFTDGVVREINVRVLRIGGQVESVTLWKQSAGGKFEWKTAKAGFCIWECLKWESWE